jgi:hypothetical protein
VSGPEGVPAAQGEEAQEPEQARARVTAAGMGWVPGEEGVAEAGVAEA